MPTDSKILAATAALLAIAVPGSAQVPYPVYPQPIPQPYPPPYAYQHPDYGVDVVQQMVDGLLGDRYNPDDRMAAGRCASAALMQAERDYPPYGYNRYGQAYPQPYSQPYGQAYPQPYGQPYNQPYGQPYANPGFVPMRVVAITEIARWSNGVHVRGLIDSGNVHGGYGSPYAYNDPRYAPAGDLTFSCSADYRGSVSNLRVERNNAVRPY